MRRLLLIVIFLIVLVITAVAYTPLGFILRNSGLSQMNIGWAKVDGTLREGRISGFYIQNQPIGDVTLSLKLTSLFSLAPRYDVQWGGAGGRGSGIVTLRAGSIEGHQIRAQQSISALESVAVPIRVLGGDIRLQDGAFKVSPTGCESASGVVTSDVFQRAAEDYGTEFDKVSGPVSCDAGQFVIDLAGASSAGDEVTISARTSLLGEAAFHMDVVTLDNNIAFALSQFGFEAEDGAWIYRHDL